VGGTRERGGFESGEWQRSGGSIVGIRTHGGGDVSRRGPFVCRYVLGQPALADAVRFCHAGGVRAVRVGQGRDLVRDPRGWSRGRLPRRSEDVERVSLTCPESLGRLCDVSMVTVIVTRKAATARLSYFFSISKYLERS
jgi:hypothetical protein